MQTAGAPLKSQKPRKIKFEILTWITSGTLKTEEKNAK
jgi:hypothetical protein